MAWLWHLQDLEAGAAVAHTVSVGAGRPADLDNCIYAATRFGPGKGLETVQKVQGRLRQAQIDALGQQWVDTCYQVCTVQKDFVMSDVAGMEY